ncbi:MAG TPA: heme ABC transporter ATP-binding protein CcmA [Porticoccaceae bacterium]|nr:heme ABC transporter ATP-binding protein CcmA [Porticoccaceae bacterium]
MRRSQVWSRRLTSAPLLEFQNISFLIEDRPLFQGVCGSLTAGEALQINGSNGSGKTTLLQILATLKTMSSGTVSWRGNVASNNIPYRREMAYLGHQAGLKMALSPRQNLLWCNRLFSLDRSGEQITSVLHRMRVLNRADLPCSALSAGQLRRVALAALLLREACLWLLDEPFSALDIEGVDCLVSLLDEHRARGGVVVFSSHHDARMPNVGVLELAAQAGS